LRCTIGGARVRVRLSNALGEEALRIGSVHIGRRDGGANIVAGSNTRLLFAGRSTATLADHSELLSDPVDFACHAGDDLLLSVHVASAHDRLTGHLRPKDISYLSTAGDHGTAGDASSFTRVVPHWFVASALLVGPTAAPSLVAIGDSITDSGGTPRGGYRGWTDLVARRVAALPPARQFGIANVAISGNRLLSERRGGGPTILSRLQRDALSHDGADTLFILAGINDIYGADETASRLIAALAEVAARARRFGLRPAAGTLLPARRQGFNASRENTRLAVNEWLRTTSAYDGIVDFDRALRDPANPERLLREYDSGDGLHPSNAGAARMAETFLSTPVAARLSPAVSGG
jgi:lysophospholipase L1-like esterase